ncbi:hypothetical protein SDC9_211640 [bioreactor metagenome]|uniref:Uncharacterized protein n=1 Tax=bioreactor metagenome TaxID=1076179 RepID=A0A645JXK0_9ZZZZ
MPHEIHSADDSMRLAFERAVAHRSDPRGDASAASFVARGDKAAHLRRTNQVIQQRIRRLDLHRWRQDGVPVGFCRSSEFWHIERCGIRHLGSQKDSEANSPARRQFAGKGEFPVIRRRRERNRFLDSDQANLAG